MTWYFYDKNGAIVEPQQPDSVSVGLVSWFVTADAGAPTLPSAEWLLCNGASLATASYPELFSVIGYSYGGAGANFNLPNLSNGNLALGANATNPTGTTRTANFHTHGGTSVGHTHSMPAHTHGSPSHTHTLTFHQHQVTDHSHGLGSFAVGAAVGAEVARNTGANTAADQNHAHTLTGNTGGMTQVTHTSTQSTTSTGSYAGGTSDAAAPVQTDTGQIPVSTPSEILPPYFNVYFIIKVQDL